MSGKRIVYLIAVIEILIGVITIAGLLLSGPLAFPKKTTHIFFFVFVCSMISVSLGAGLLALNDIARKLLIFFSGYVILTKVLVFVGILHFTGELITAISDPVKNTISIIYHLFVIISLSLGSLKVIFVKGVKDA